MKILALFNAYDELLRSTPEISNIFAAAGMRIDSQKLDFGFFPLGSGMLTDTSKCEEAQIEEGGTMVLGHDFGIASYIENKCKGQRETDSRTIQNLFKVGLDREKTFFTNYYLGLRDDKTHPGMTMTRLSVPRTKAYSDLCHSFFLTQLSLINPATVVCLGKEVGKILKDVFSKYTNDKSFLSLFASNDVSGYVARTDDIIYGKRKFVLIPHPSYAHINWKNDIKNKIIEALK